MKDNVLKNNTHIIIAFIYLVSIFIFVISNFFLFTNSSRIILNLILVAFIQLFDFFVFGVDVISSISLLTSLVLIPSVAVYYLNESDLGALTFNLSYVPISMYQLSYYTLIFVLMWSFLAYLFKINVFERQVLDKPLIKLSHTTIITNNLIAIAFAFIALPSLPKLSLNIGEAPIGNGLLPGHAWNQLVIVALLFNLPYIRKHMSVLLTYLFVIVWFILHGERADLAGLFFGFVILAFLSKHVRKLTKVIVAIGFLVIALFFISVKSHFSYGISSSFIHLTTFSTVSDISYISNASLRFISNFGYMHGKMFLSMMESIIPSFGGFCNIEILFKNLYMYPGGGSIITTPLMDGGTLGIVLYTLFYLMLIRFVVTRKSPMFRYELLILICAIPRISWYGVNYVFSSMLFFVPFIYFVDKYVNR